MRLVSWNCNMAYRKKYSSILELKPDIVVIPECECEEKLKFGNLIPCPTDFAWYGENRDKGLGIFSYGSFKISQHKWYNPEFKKIIPILVTNGNYRFNMFAIWANNPRDKEYQYIGQVWKAVNYYRSFLSERDTILIGDFNSNAIWDRPEREANHSTVVHELDLCGIYSVYHQYFNELQGHETYPTFYMYRHYNKAYHIDYCFASHNLMKKLIGMEVGSFKNWISLSDHVPLIVDINTDL